MQNFKRKSETVEAMCWSKHGDHPAVLQLPRRSVGNKKCKHCYMPAKDHGRVILSRAAWQSVCPGDWVVQTDYGTINIYSPTEFWRRFEAMS